MSALVGVNPPELLLHILHWPHPLENEKPFRTVYNNDKNITFSKVAFMLFDVNSSSDIRLSLSLSILGRYYWDIIALHNVMEFTLKMLDSIQNTVSEFSERF